MDKRVENHDLKKFMMNFYWFPSETQRKWKGNGSQCFEIMDAIIRLISIVQNFMT